MEQWKEYRLENFIHFNPTISLKKGTVARKIAMDNLIPHSRKIYSWNIEPYSGGAKFQNGDTIMARITPCLENGKHSYVSILDEGEIAYGSTEYIVMRGINGISNNLFIYYLSQYSKFKNAAVKSMVGSSGRQRAQVDVLKNLAFNLPGLTEQKRIADFLSSLDDKIELNRRINDNLEKQAQALFKSWFVDFEPFKDGEFVDSELGMIPKGWRVESLSSLGSIICGKTPPKSNPEYYNGSIPFVKIPDMHNNIFITKSEDNLSEKGMRYQANKTIPPYSILVSCIATVGLVSMNTKTCQTNQQINAYIPDKDFYRFYLFILLKSMKEYLITLGSGGTATLNVNTSQFSNIKVVVPNAEILVKFSGLVSPIFQNIKLACDENFALSQLRDTLLPRLMSGELRINELNC